MRVRGFTVGPFQENAFLISRDGSDRAVLIDPGDEPDLLLGAIEQEGVALDAILITHTDVDHVGAVAPVARATGAPVYCPKLEVDRLADIMAHLPMPGLGPYEGYQADETVEGGERLHLAGLDIEVVFTPGHTEGHVTYAFPEGPVIASGDVLFQSSIGRTDRPNGDHQTLLRSIATLLERYPDETTVLPGHMGATTLGHERATNPFLAELSR
ncbi:MAG TPA: MBL fold metallo-hydrolase [Solirubrobacteraceae bacterium]|nr:MBL fold metallo-hydrolase [Solirubrobacteraceae bacterium]